MRVHLIFGISGVVFAMFFTLATVIFFRRGRVNFGLAYSCLTIGYIVFAFISLSAVWSVIK